MEEPQELTAEIQTTPLMGHVATCFFKDVHRLWISDYRTSGELPQIVVQMKISGPLLENQIRVGSCDFRESFSRCERAGPRNHTN
jgi:hypothetical protein